jgi:hypothetical protein
VKPPRGGETQKALRSERGRARFRHRDKSRQVVSFAT